MEPLDVDLDSLQRGAEQLEQAKENVRAVFESFQASLDGYADAFGGDDIGTLLAVAHAACVNAAAECFGTNLDELETYVDGLFGMADRYQRAEEDIGASFARLLGSLGG